MDNVIKEFIEENKDLIENNEWEEIYEKANNQLTIYSIGDFTSLLLSADINPLDYLDYIPKKFLAYQDIPSFKIPDSVTSIGYGAFYSCTSLTSVTIPNSVTSIGSYAFANCTSLTSVTIPDRVMSIGDGAFYNCISLTSVTIGSGVTSINLRAFYNCTSLTNITFNGTKAQWQSISKGLQWRNNAPLKIIIHCIDGDLNI